MQQRGDYIDEKVGSILTDLGYTKTRHHDKYKNIQPFWNEEMHRRCMAAIFDYGLKEASPKVIYPALREFDSTLRPENIKSHLQKYRSNSKANQLEYRHFFERYLRKEKKVAMRQKLLQSSQAKEGDVDSTGHVRDIRDPSIQIASAPLNSLSEATQPISPVPPLATSTSSVLPTAYSNSVDSNSHSGVSPISSRQTLNEDEDDQGMSFHFQEDPFMAHQVALHDDIISKHSIRQQRMGLDGINNDNRYFPLLDYESFFENASVIESEKPLETNEAEMGNPLFFLQEPEN